MEDGLTTHQITYVFDVEVEQDNDEEEVGRYQASCSRLTGCVVHARSEAAALRKMEQAIGIWLDVADGQLSDDPFSIKERIDALLPD